MDQCHVGVEIWHLKVFVITEYLFGGELSLVGDCLRREGADIKVSRDIRISERFTFDNLPDFEELCVEFFERKAFAVLNEDLLHSRLCRLRRLTKSTVI